MRGAAIHEPPRGNEEQAVSSSEYSTCLPSVSQAGNQKSPSTLGKGHSRRSPETRPRRITWDSGNSRVFWLLRRSTLPAFPETSPVAHEGISSAVTAAGQRRSFTGFPNAVSVFLTLMSQTIVANKDSIGKAF